MIEWEYWKVSTLRWKLCPFFLRILPKMGTYPECQWTNHQILIKWGDPPNKTLFNSVLVMSSIKPPTFCLNQCLSSFSIDIHYIKILGPLGTPRGLHQGPRRPTSTSCKKWVQRKPWSWVCSRANHGVGVGWLVGKDGAGMMGWTFGIFSMKHVIWSWIPSDLNGVESHPKWDSNGTLIRFNHK